jgi:hypothetical protein
MRTFGLVCLYMISVHHNCSLFAIEKPSEFQMCSSQNAEHSSLCYMFLKEIRLPFRLNFLVGIILRISEILFNKSNTLDSMYMF